MGEREILNEQDLQTILSHSISDVELAQAVQGIDRGSFADVHRCLQFRPGA
jgi:hypothetical protein